MNKKNKIILLVTLFAITISLALIGSTFSSRDAMLKAFEEENINNLNTYLSNNFESTNKRYLSKIVDENGNVPASKYYTSSQVDSRSIKKLFAFEDKIFMGLGDWNANTGPVKMVYYDTNTGKIEMSGTIEDEAVEDYKLIDEKLYTTGRDPKSGWGYGSYYAYNSENNTWEQHKYNGGWIHIFDIEKYNNKIFLSGSVTNASKKTPIQVSNDNGETFENVRIVCSDGTDAPSNENYRGYALFIYKDELYANLRGHSGDSKYNGIYKYDEQKNQFSYMATTLPLIYPYTVNRTPASHKYYYVNPIQFADKYLHISGNKIYEMIDNTNNNLTFRELQTGIDNYVFEDGVIVDDTLYLLSYIYNDDKTFDVSIYSTKDLSNYTLVYEFKCGALPYSMEIYKNIIYIGLGNGNSIKDTTQVGTLYQIDLNKLKRQVSLNKSNEQVLITAGGNTYPVDYILSDDKITFSMTLTFDDSMKKNDWATEFSKLENLNLIYAMFGDNSEVKYNDYMKYYNNLVNNNVDVQYEYNTTNEFIQNLFGTKININNGELSIKSGDIEVTNEGKYNIPVELIVYDIDDVITSDRYQISDKYNYVYVGTENNADTIKNNIISPNGTNIEVDIDNHLVKLLKNSGVIREYKLINFITSNKIINKSIYVANMTNQEIISSLNIFNGTASVSGDSLQIKCNENVIDEYKIMRFSTNNLKVLSNNKIYIGNKKKNDIESSINAVNVNKKFNNDKIVISSDNNVLGEYDTLSIDFGKYNKFGDKIAVPNNITYSEFINNINKSTDLSIKIYQNETLISDGNIEEGMILKVFYANAELDSIMIKGEYLIFNDRFIIDEENRLISKIDVNKNVRYIISKIDTSGKITVMNNHDEIINDNNLIGTGSRVNIKLTDKIYDYLIIIYGDIDGDGKISLNDVNKISNYVYNDESDLASIYVDAADYDKNGIYNLEDIMKTAKKINNIEEKSNLADRISNKYYESNNLVKENINNYEYYFDENSNLMSDLDNNIRYYGANPNNYVLFNCEEYPDKNCEVWRIIGVFDNKVKLVRNSSIGNFSYDNKTTSTGALYNSGSHNWSDARIMKLLNPGYDNETYGGSLYYNSGSGKCYSGNNNAVTNCNFNDSGIKNETTKNIISDTTYYLGRAGSVSEIYASDSYEGERSNDVYDSFTTTWTGKIALPYPSDYGYAVDLKKCNQVLRNYENELCVNNNWLNSILRDSNSAASVLLNSYSYINPTNPLALSSAVIIVTSESGAVMNSAASTVRAIIPVLYLDTNVEILSGDGTSTNPYHLNVINS